MEVKYSEVQVGQEFTLNGEVYVRLPHGRARGVKNDKYISVKKHKIVGCENPYATLSKGKVLTEEEIKQKRLKDL